MHTLPYIHGVHVPLVWLLHNVHLVWFFVVARPPTYPFFLQKTFPRHCGLGRGRQQAMKPLEVVNRPNHATLLSTGAQVQQIHQHLIPQCEVTPQVDLTDNQQPWSSTLLALILCHTHLST